MTLPPSVKIGTFTFRITDDLAEYNAACAKAEVFMWGEIHYGEEEIVLNPRQTEGHKRYALLHEIMHGCFHLTNRAHDTEEDAILSLAAPLLGVLRDNPDLVSYLIAD